MTTLGTDEIIATFRLLTVEQQNDVLKELLRSCSDVQLQELGLSRSVDFVTYFSKDLAERVFSWLDVCSLCRVACCSHLWRKRANSNRLWRAHCLRKGWIRLESNRVLFQSSSTAKCLSPVKASHRFVECVTQLSLSPPICHWKDVYIRASQLEVNWKKGLYTVLPILTGHKKRVTALDCDGVFAVCGSAEQSLRVWDVARHTCSQVWDNLGDEVTCIKIKDGQVVCGCADGIIRRFNVLNCHMIGDLQGHHGSIECLAFDGFTVISGSTDKSVRVWSFTEGKCMHVLNGHTEDVTCVEMVGLLGMSAAHDATLRLWDLEQGVCRYELVGHKEVVYCCQFDENRVVSGSADATLRIWDTTTGKTKHVLIGHEAEIYCLQYNDVVIASGSADSSVRVWNHQGLCLHELKEHLGIVRCLHLTRTRLVTGGDVRKIIIWDTERGEMCNIIHRNPTSLHQMWVDDTRLITASPDAPGTITIINFW